MLIYRACTGTARSLTPRPEKDTRGAKRGLSAFERSEQVPGEAGAVVKVQVIETDNLSAPLRVERHGDGHVSIAPAEPGGEIDDEALVSWAASRDAEEPDDLTKKVMAAIVD